jgi:cation diffusion facilitator family transporter
MKNERFKSYASIRRVLLIVLALNWLVALAKVVFGLASRSASMVADGFHSLSDGASNIIGLIGIHLAFRPKDIDHPYGHKKYETFFSLGIAFLLFLVAIGIVHESLGRLANPLALKITGSSFITMAVTMAVNLLVMYYEKKRGKELKSDILVSDAMHTKADIFTSLSVILALFAAKAGYPMLDPVISVIISSFIAYSGYEIAREGSAILCDTAAMTDVRPIVEIVLKVPGVKACHKVRTRGRSDDIYIDLHVQVANDTRIDEAHKICYDIEESIKKSIPGASDVVVHVEPSN